MDIQKIMDIVSNAVADTRSDYHITLGEMIEIVSSQPKGMLVRYSDGGVPSRASSYRGYYSDLAFIDAQDDDKMTAKAFLDILTSALGETFEGYKGGDYEMTDRTPLWRAEYGRTGPAITDVEIGECIVLKTKSI